MKNIAGNSTVLYELSDKPRTMTSSMVVDEIIESFKNDDVPTWAKVLWSTDYPQDYFVTFAAIVSTLIFLILPSTIAHFVLTTLITLILPSYSRPFLLESYLP